MLTNVPRETFELLENYVELLLKWNKKINLIAPGTEGEIWDRHVEDSLQLVDLIPEQTTSLADLGSGGGLPGIVIAIARPKIAVTLVERDARKAAFLTQAVIQLGLKNAKVENADIKKITSKHHLVTARALASLDVLCELSSPLLLKDAICLFPKGENFATELEEAKKRWDFTHHIYPSKTHGQACIISVSELKQRT